MILMNKETEKEGVIDMENVIWRFGVVANITEYHIGDDGKKYKGTKPFTSGTKVYLGGKNWDSTRQNIGVIGRNRFGRIALEWIPIDCLTSIRTQRIYKPRVLEIIDQEERMEGWDWWKRTTSDRKETEEFVKNWKLDLSNQD